MCSCNDIIFIITSSNTLFYNNVRPEPERLEVMGCKVKDKKPFMERNSYRFFVETYLIPTFNDQLQI